MLKGFELLQPPDIGVRGGQVRLRLRVIAGPLVQLLLRDRVRFAQFAPAVSAGARQFQRRHHLLAGSLRLREFLVHFRRIQIGQ